MSDVSFRFQILNALGHMHKHGYFHRDIKPENILVMKDSFKLADFGLAREIRSRPPYTDYVATRWYRAPECLLRSTTYTSAIDVWAMGAMMIELFTLKPMFPGKDEVDTLNKVTSVLGTPTAQVWPEGLKMASNIGYKFPTMVKMQLSAIMPSASTDALKLIGDMIQWDPKKRPSAAECLQYAFFKPMLLAVESNPSKDLMIEGKELSDRPEKADTLVVPSKVSKEFEANVLGKMRVEDKPPPKPAPSKKEEASHIPSLYSDKGKGYSSYQSKFWK
jgi:serine/threonine protein kinase